MKKNVSLIIVLLLLVTAFSCATYQERGASSGAVIGGVTGAFVDQRNPWRGGVIGAVLGAIAGATIADISLRGGREVYDVGRPVEYRTEDGRGYYRAEPEGETYYPDAHTKCKKIHEKVWEDGRLVKDRVREVCEGEKYERRY